MLESITGFLSAVKGTTPVMLLGVALATGVGLFADVRFISALGLLEVRTQYRPYLGVVFLLSSSLLTAQGVAATWRFAGSIRERRRERSRAQEAMAGLQDALHALTLDEQVYLVPFILGHENTQYFRIQDGVAGGLVAKNILFRSSNLGSILSGFAHNVQPWAREYLAAHPELLTGATAVPRGGPPRW